MCSAMFKLRARSGNHYYQATGFAILETQNIRSVYPPHEGRVMMGFEKRAVKGSAIRFEDLLVRTDWMPF